MEIEKQKKWLLKAIYQTVKYNYDRAGGGGEGTGATIDDEGIANLGDSGGNGARSTPPLEVTFSVMWNGQKEIFVLKP